MQFTANLTNGPAPLTVIFTDLTTGIVTNYLWSFGDNSTSPAANPAHTFSTPGNFTVSLMAIGPGGSNQLARTSYITVTGKSSPLVLSAVGFNAAGLFQFRVASTVGRSLTIQASSNLTNWTPLTTLFNTTGVMQFQDTNSRPCQFYRAAIQP